MAQLDISPIPASLAPPKKASLRILYADDVPELRDVTRMSFEREGHQIECHPDGQSGLERLTEDLEFDLVITDHHMPRMDGLEFVQRLRELPFMGKIMVFSSELSTDVAASYQRFGVDRILYKPVYPSVLRRAMADLFEPPASRGSANPFSMDSLSSHPYSTR